MRVLLLALLALATSTAGAADFDYATYRSAWLSDAAATFQLDPEADWLIDASMKKFHTVAAWTGQHRDITPERRRFVEAWAVALRLPEGTAALFGHEIEVRQR